MAAKICFSVGHGKSNGKYDPGACSGGYEEFKIVKEIAKYAQAYYNNTYAEQSDLINYDGSLSLNDRIKKINAASYDFVIEVHLNAGGGTGTECYYYHKSTRGQKYADKICDNVASALGVKQRPNYGDDKAFDKDKDGGDKTKLNAKGKDYFGIIRDTKPTAVLVECVFIDTKNDLDKVKTAAGQKKCGEAIAKAVAEVRGVKKKSTSNASTSKTASTAASSTAASPATTNLRAGTKLALKGVALYGASSSKSKAGTKTGTFYVWSADVVNNRIRITNSTANVGKAGQITGWISVADAKKAASGTATVAYYKKYTGTSGSIVDALKAIGVDSSYSSRKKIAKANGITLYTSSAAQNIKLLTLLKQGKLIKA